MEKRMMMLQRHVGFPRDFVRVRLLGFFSDGDMIGCYGVEKSISL
jgi:hypothetical protein